jgi:hypothetical protein
VRPSAAEREGATLIAALVGFTGVSLPPIEQTFG